MVLVPQVLDAVSPALVRAAGGIADGRGVAGALALGADGVWVGTRLVATTEAAVHPEHIMYRFGEIFADVAVICSQKTASRKGFAAVSLASRSSRLRITAKCSLLFGCYSLLLDQLMNPSGKFKSETAITKLQLSWDCGDFRVNELAALVFRR